MGAPNLGPYAAELAHARISPQYIDGACAHGKVACVLEPRCESRPVKPLSQPAADRERVGELASKQ